MNTPISDRWIDRLLSQLGMLVGIEGLAVDTDDVCVMQIDDVEVLLQWHADADRLQLLAALGEPCGDFDGALLEVLLTANHLRLDLGDATLGIDPDRLQITLSERLDIQPLDAQALAMALSQFTDCAGEWRARIAQMTAEQASAAGWSAHAIPAGHQRV